MRIFGYDVLTPTFSIVSMLTPPQHFDLKIHVKTTIDLDEDGFDSQLGLVDVQSLTADAQHAVPDGLALAAVAPFPLANRFALFTSPVRFQFENRLKQNVECNL